MAGCDENELPNDPGQPQHRFPLEVEPVLSPDGSHVYYVGVDTTDQERSSILRAQVDMPVRVDLAKPGTLTADTTHSPTISPSMLTLDYLDETRLYECVVMGSQCTGIEVGSFYGVAWMGDSLLAMAASDSIYVAGEGRVIRTFLMNGWDPRSEGDTSIVCVVGSDPEWRIVLAGRNGVFDTLLMHAGSRPHWPDFDATHSRLAYTVASADSFLVLVAELTNLTLDTVASSNYPKVCLASSTLLLLTGPNGVLHHVSPSGGTPQPWIHVEEE